MNKVTLSTDVTRITLAVILIAILIAACFWIMKPFLSAIIWAAMIVIATWPLMLTIQEKLGKKRWLAVVVMTLFLLLILIAPLTLAVSTLIDKAQQLASNSQILTELRIPPPPDWLLNLPLEGPRLAGWWQEYAHLDQYQLAQRLMPHSQKIISWFLAQAGSVGMMIVHCLLTVIISAIFYGHGEAAADGIRRFVRRIAGKSGEDAAVLAARAIRGVAIGIVGTALVQTFLGGAGLLIAGIPAIAILSAVLFLLCVAQIGPALVLIPVTIWLFSQGQTSMGIFMLVWTVFVCTIDNFVRPMLIKKGADLPLLLIFAGVLGGLVSFGIIGLFIGPVALAVTYTLLKEWVAAGEQVEQLEISG
ncbi:MAG: AI-2E family transporter YdiK [Geobacter sp.]|nr:AI-2E family transporter YdiK [Geobacter sp.]